MKKKNFLKQLRGLPLDTQVKVLIDWSGPNGKPELEPANSVTEIGNEPQGITDEHFVAAYIWHDPDKTQQTITLKDFRKLFRNIDSYADIKVVEGYWQQNVKGEDVLYLEDANSAYLIKRPGESPILFFWYNVDYKEPDKIDFTEI